MALDLADVHKRFGVDQLLHCLYQAFPHSLRFELGGAEKATVPRFLRAFDLARCLAGRVFDASPDVLALIDVYGGKRSGVRERTALRALADAGFDPGRFVALGHFRQDPDLAEDDHVYRRWYGSPVDRSGIDVLLWCALARELPIAPSARFFGVYFVDLARGLILHSYDDRGMDLAAVSPGDLSAFEAEFGPWILSTGERR